ncbi:hypothetical protein GCM10023334_121470 [Nonomuraea thailandensis]
MNDDSLTHPPVREPGMPRQAPSDEVHAAIGTVPVPEGMTGTRSPARSSTYGASHCAHARAATTPGTSSPAGRRAAGERRPGPTGVTSGAGNGSAGARSPG